MTKQWKDVLKEKFEITNTNLMKHLKNCLVGGYGKNIIRRWRKYTRLWIDIQVQPTGKKLQNMMLLSGGEKSTNSNSITICNIKNKSITILYMTKLKQHDDVNVYKIFRIFKELNKLFNSCKSHIEKRSMELGRKCIWRNNGRKRYPVKCYQ